MVSCGDDQATPTTYLPTSALTPFALLRANYSMSVRYCSDDCQTSHWKEGHRNECRKLKKLYRECVIIEQPSTSKGDIADHAILTYNAGEVPMTSYRRPSHAAIDETFTVKVQRVSGRDTLLVYDKTRECEFCLGPDQQSYRKLLEKVKTEQATAGTKAYMAASFDKQGNCTFFLNRTTMKTW
jgi:endo-1,4-beta-mannosidase